MQENESFPINISREYRLALANFGINLQNVKKGVNYGKFSGGEIIKHLNAGLPVIHFSGVRVTDVLHEENKLLYMRPFMIKKTPKEGNVGFSISPLLVETSPLFLELGELTDSKADLSLLYSNRENRYFKKIKLLEPPTYTLLSTQFPVRFIQEEFLNHLSLDYQLTKVDQLQCVENLFTQTFRLQDDSFFKIEVEQRESFLPQAIELYLGSLNSDKSDKLYSYACENDILILGKKETDRLYLKHDLFQSRHLHNILELIVSE